jgi:hypothetical protein
MKVVKWLIACVFTLAVWATPSFAHKDSPVDQAYRAYTGPSFQQDEVAIVKIKKDCAIPTSTNVRSECAVLSQIDGHSILNYWDGTPRPIDSRSYATFRKDDPFDSVSIPSMIELPPGMHTFVFGIYYQGQRDPRSSSETRELPIHVDAGRRYLVRFEFSACEIHKLDWEPCFGFVTKEVKKF